MAVTLVPMPPSDFARWLEADREHYIGERIAAGEDSSTAIEVADEQLEQLFPAGVPRQGHYVFWLQAGDDVVGSLWLGEALSGPQGLWWVWNIEIYEPFRGRGLGRSAMLLGERHARALGANRLGLNVFGHNDIARRLYTDLGYETMSIRMEKPL